MKVESSVLCTERCSTSFKIYNMKSVGVRRTWALVERHFPPRPWFHLNSHYYCSMIYALKAVDSPGERNCVRIMLGQ